MTKKDEEEKQSLAATLGKIAVAVLGAMAAGGAGSVAIGPAVVDDGGLKDRVSQLEHACSSYDVRLATQETKLDGVEVNMMDIKKDLADIRTTSTQILLLMKQE